MLDQKEAICGGTTAFCAGEARKEEEQLAGGEVQQAVETKRRVLCYI